MYTPYRRSSDETKVHLYSDDPINWSVDEVCEWFGSQPRLAEFVPFIKAHRLDGHILLNYLSNSVLRDELGVTAFGQRVKLLEALEALKWKSSNEKADYTEMNYRNGSWPSQTDSRTVVDYSFPRTVAIKEKAKSLSKSPEPKNEDPTNQYSRNKSLSLGNTSALCEKEIKKAANRMADAEKKRRKRAELKKDPIAYAIYLQKERDRNAKRREKMKGTKKIKEYADTLENNQTKRTSDYTSPQLQQYNLRSQSTGIQKISFVLNRSNTTENSIESSNNKTQESSYSDNNDDNINNDLKLYKENNPLRLTSSNAVNTEL
ncbi:hypothetical protein BB560_001369 [Smittium megazygosporum]|uniref:SAM domain-containing protein n=1 Tax=Smittium megazygosporum TaxID=133381 RepID=A0A2T9ZHT8_9FUNG|nr:hypothetical protein BB560_001369 [Smittium megazygosporum]